MLCTTCEIRSLSACTRQGSSTKVNLHIQGFFLNIVHSADEHAADEFVEV